jgi:hypothetical protein
MSENSTPFGSFRVYLSSWRLAWPHVLTMDIEHIGAAMAMPPNTASNPGMLTIARMLPLFRIRTVEMRDMMSLHI